MKTHPFLGSAIALLLAGPPLHAEVPAGNLWPNATFEDGADLDLPTGTPTGWSRGGNDGSICQLSSLAAVSGTHSLAVVDAGNTYGEWYYSLPLPAGVAAGDSFALQWYELFDIAEGNEERVTVLFFNGNALLSEKHFAAHGQSAGWAGSLAASPFAKRNEQVVVPASATRFQVSLVSGGPAEGQGTMLMDDFSVVLVPESEPVEGLLTGNFWPNPTFEAGTDLDDPAIGKPTPWNRGGSDAGVCTVSTVNSVTQTHSLALDDQTAAGYGEWYCDFPLIGLVRGGSLVHLQWFELFHIEDGEMRLTAVFFDGQGGAIGDRHFVVRNDSTGWSGDAATSTFVKRNETIALPAGTKTLRVSLVSGGPSETTGLYLLDNISAALAPTDPVTLFGNFWPNAGFEQGDNLDDSAAGQPANWNRGGSEAAICQVAQANYNSSTHALAVVDNGTGYGEWYADFPLGVRASPGDTLGVQWFELFHVSEGGEMRLSALFFNAANTVVGEKHFVTQGSSSAWAGDLPNSSFTKRNENLVVPAGAARLRFSLVSGGPGETTGVMVVDDLSLAPPPIPPVVLDGSFWPNPGFEDGAQLDNPKAGQPTGWSRGGSDVSFDQVSTVNWTSTAHALAVLDTAEDAYGEWYRSHDLAPLALAPDAVLQAQWWWAYDTVGDMRFTFLFIGADNAEFGKRDVVVKDQSPGWSGSLATSPLARRVVRLPVPEGTLRVQTALASGGSSSVTGTILLDDLSVRVAPPNADTDGDGVPDLEEDFSGTDPEDAVSFLHVTALTRESDATQVTWTSVPGRSYAVEFVERINDLFAPLPGAESLPGADAPTTSFSDTRVSTPASGYYRVRVLAN